MFRNTFPMGGGAKKEDVKDFLSGISVPNPYALFGKWFCVCVCVLSIIMSMKNLSQAEMIIPEPSSSNYILGV